MRGSAKGKKERIPRSDHSMNERFDKLILFTFSGLVLLLLSGCPPRPPMIPDFPAPPKLPKPPGLLLDLTMVHDRFLGKKFHSP